MDQDILKSQQQKEQRLITRCSREGKAVDMVYMDLEKAFDKLPQ